jgi:tRNA A37 methylthiotransferase MiaB
LRAQVGAELSVLVEGPSRPGSAQHVGRSRRNEIVHLVPVDGCGAGALVDVRIEKAHKHSLEGSVVRVVREATSGQRPAATFRRVVLPVAS